MTDETDYFGTPRAEIVTRGGVVYSSGIRTYGAPTVPGNSAEEDAKHIAMWGNTIIPEEFERFFEE